MFKKKGNKMGQTTEPKNINPPSNKIKGAKKPRTGSGGRVKRSKPMKVGSGATTNIMTPPVGKQ